MQHPNQTFPHNRLEAYNVALEMAVQAKRLADRIPRGHRSLADQLLRAASSTVLNTAEGANRYTAGAKRQRYSEARSECGEVAAAAELLVALELAPRDECVALLALADHLPTLPTAMMMMERTTIMRRI